jgi:hypothetical protein
VDGYAAASINFSGCVAAAATGHFLAFPHKKVPFLALLTFISLY